MTRSPQETQDWLQRLAFLGIDEDDQERLEALQPVLDKQADTIVGAFYRHLLSFEPTQALLSDPDVKRRLLEKQRGYLLSLGVPMLDEAYELHRRLIGQTHLRVGLEPRWYLGAYALYASLLVPLIGEHFKADPTRAEQTVISLLKTLLLDAQIAMESYIEKREEQLEHLNRELAAATRDLERAYQDRGTELRETTERARAAEELASVATIVAGLAHEIGTPMGVIRGHAELLEGSVSDERGHWRLQTIRDQIDRISNIIQTLLNMARPRYRDPALVDVRAVVEDSLAFLAERFSRRGIGVERDLAQTASVYGDAEKLQQLLLNLFLNAVDAMEEGGTLRVRLRVSDKGDVNVQISDTGPGIERETLARIFDPFYTSKPAGKGSGLGLTVCREIVRDHGGTIEVTSKVGSGTQFRIGFPPPRFKRGRMS